MRDENLIRKTTIYAKTANRKKGGVTPSLLPNNIQLGSLLLSRLLLIVIRRFLEKSSFAVMNLLHRLQF
jgi:hypothetical protein